MKSIAALAFLASVVLLKADQVMFSNGATRIYEKVVLMPKAISRLMAKPIPPNKSCSGLPIIPPRSAPHTRCSLRTGVFISVSFLPRIGIPSPCGSNPWESRS